MKFASVALMIPMVVGMVIFLRRGQVEAAVAVVGFFLLGGISLGLWFVGAGWRLPQE